MTEKNNGGPAFPVPAETWNLTGMSLRDYFAAKLACGQLANPGLRDLSYEEFFKICYEMADAMLEIREEKWPVKTAQTGTQNF